MMTPAYTPLTTLAQRETMRKRRFFSLLLFVALMLILGYIAYAGIMSLTYQMTISSFAVGITVLTLWLNRRGYLTLACVIFFFSSVFTTLLAAQTTALIDPLILLWTCFLMTIFLFGLGFFVPAWMVLPGAMLENLLFFWYLLIFNHLHVVSDLELKHALIYLCLLIYGSAFLSISYAITTKRAVIRADRTDELEHAYASLEVAHTAIQRQALTDGLTGLPNHGAIVEQIEEELLLCQSNQCNCAIIFVDVDHFKSINDTWGHAAGDAVLHEVGQRLREGIREDDSIGRYGGEEFAILLSNIGQSQAFDLAERLRCSLAEAPCLWQQEATQVVLSIPLTASFGLATYPLDGFTASGLLDTADAAMYIAKHTGRNRVCLPDEADEASLKEEKNQQLSV